MLRLFERRGAYVEPALLVDPFRDRGVHPIRVDGAHDRVLALVDVLAPNGDAKFARHERRKMNLETRKPERSVLFSGFLVLKFVPLQLHRGMSPDYAHGFREQLASG